MTMYPSEVHHLYLGDAVKLKIILTANDNASLAKGLMHTKPIKIDECALFIFKHKDDHSFWNKNVDYPISLFFLDENFQIKNIGKLEAHQEKPCRADYQMTKYVVEGHIDLPKAEDIQINDYCMPDNNYMKILKGKRKDS